METIGEIAKKVEASAVDTLKEEGRLSWREALTQVGVEKPETKDSKLEGNLAQSTEFVNGTFSSFRLQEEVRQQTEQAQTQIRFDLEQYRLMETQRLQFKLKGEFVTIQGAIEQVEESMGEDTHEVQTEKPFYSEYDLAVLRMKLKNRQEQAKIHRNPVKSAVRFIGDRLGISALWTQGANRDSMTETAALTQAAG